MSCVSSHCDCVFIVQDVFIASRHRPGWLCYIAICKIRLNVGIYEQKKWMELRTSRFFRKKKSICVQFLIMLCDEVRSVTEWVKEREEQICQTTYIFHCEKHCDDAGLYTLYLCGFGTMCALKVCEWWKQKYDQRESYFHLAWCLSI